MKEANNLTVEDLEQITHYAYNLMSWKDIAYLMKIPIHDFQIAFSDTGGELYTAYQEGKLKRKLELRIPILEMASKGSPQAEMLSVKFMEDQYLDETDD